MKVMDDLTSVTQSWNISDRITSAPIVSPKPIQDCPVYFEANSSCLTNRSPQETFEVLIHYLNKIKRIHIDYQALNNKIKGVYYCSVTDSPCSFMIKLFHAPLERKEKYLLEVQRRQGCCIIFRKFYQQILQALTAEGVVVPFTKTQSLSSKSIVTPELGQIDLDKPTLELLMKSVGKSDTNLEHLREIIRVLATSSNSEQNRALISESFSATYLCETLATILQLSDGEVRRCGATFLGNLATLETLRGEFINKLLGIMFKVLSGSNCDSAGFGLGCSELINRETQRQIGRTLSLFSKTHAKQMSQDPSSSSYLKTLTYLQKSTNDALFQADVLSTLEQMSVH